MPPRKIYSAQEVAEILGVTNSFMYKMIKVGKAYPTLRLGKHMYGFDKKEVDRLSELRRQKAQKPVKRLITKQRSASY